LEFSGVAEGPVVAVNNAALADWPIDFWCCQDPPVNFQSVMLKLFDEKRISRLDDILVWCPSDQTDFWLPQFRVWPHSNINHKFCEENLGEVPDDVRMTDLTITAAISRCIGLGATKIHLYGCDMSGKGYSVGRDACKRDKKAWEARWVKEREVFKKAVKVWLPVEIILK
jgi:hypothetical protein